jgi:hypothetical protein
VSASPIPSAGEDKTLRRWRITLTVAAWVLIVQSALTVIVGLLGILLAPISSPGTVLGQLGPLIDRSSLAMLDSLMRQTAFLNRVQTVGSLVLLAGAIGLLLRKKWGWFVVVVVHVAAAVAVFIWVMPMFETLYRLLDPRNAGLMAWLLSVLSALAPAVVVAFLLAKPILSQFERGPKPEPSG